MRAAQSPYRKAVIANTNGPIFLLVRLPFKHHYDCKHLAHWRTRMVCKGDKVRMFAGTRHRTEVDAPTGGRTRPERPCSLGCRG